MKAADLSGKKFGKLTVIREDGRTQCKIPKWLCQCECGKTTSVNVNNLKSGFTKSCGCIRASLLITDKMKELGFDPSIALSLNPEYRSWIQINGRCYDPKNFGYQFYGAKGMEVCERWRNSFQTFCEDMGRKPSKTHTIDRIDNSKGYFPENCRWATKKEQILNRKNMGHVTFNGVTKTTLEWANEIGIKPFVLKRRLELWPIERALTTKNLNKFPASDIWRKNARALIAEVIKANDGKDAKEIRKALQKACPPDKRKYHSYRIWRQEIKALLTPHP